MYRLPGQLTLVIEHASVSDGSPTHCLPSYAGAGLVHVLSRDRDPLLLAPVVEKQVTEHVVHEAQSAHCPSTVKEIVPVMNVARDNKSNVINCVIMYVID